MTLTIDPSLLGILALFGFAAFLILVAAKAFK